MLVIRFNYISFKYGKVLKLRLEATAAKDQLSG